MNTLVFVLGCLCAAMTTVKGHFKFFKMERTEKVEIKEFEMNREPNRQVILKRPFAGTRGNVTNCGPKGYKSSIQWEPAVLNTQGVATVYWDFVAPCDLHSGNAHIDVYLPETPSHSIFSFDQKGTCEDIKSTVPTLKCPIKKNDEIKGKLTASIQRFPTGNYTIVVKITNDKAELFACGKASIELTP